MPENHPTTADPNQLNGAQKSQAALKKQRRKALPNAVQATSARTEITLKAIVSSTPKAVSDEGFPLYRLFTLDSSGNGEIYQKLTKHKIINVITGDVFSSNVTGYLLSL